MQQLPKNTYFGIRHRSLIKLLSWVTSFTSNFINERCLRYTFFVFSILVFLSSCSTIKHLEEGETLLKKTDIEIADKKAVKDLRYLKYELNTLIKQKPNTKFMWIPRQYFYYRVDEPGDTSKLNNFVRKNWAEEPAIYHSASTEKTAADMEVYMKLKGFFDAKVEYEVVHKQVKGVDKKTKVIYTVHPYGRYFLDTIQLVSKDPRINQILQKTKSESFLKKGQPVTDESYNLEARRISNYLLNHGYADFYPKLISKLLADSIGNQVNVELEILLNNDSSFHKTYTIGDISIIPLYDPKRKQDLKYDSTYNGIHFLTEDDHHFIKPKTLAKEIYFKKGDLFRAENLDKTRRQLGNLDIFQFIDIRRSVDPEVDTVLNYEIRLIPKDKQEIGSDFEVNTSKNVGSINNTGFLGTAASLSYKNRNIFRGGEVFTVRAEGGVEIDPKRSQGSLVNTWDLNIGTDFYFPKFFDLPRTSKGLRGLRIFGKKFYQDLKERGYSKASLNYNIISSVGNYQIDIFTASLGYNLDRTPRRKHQFTPTGINFLNPRFDTAFQRITLDPNIYLRNSLREQLFTGIWLREYSYTYQSRSKRRSSWFLQVHGETSGLEISAVNAAYNWLGNKKDTFALNNTFEFSKYLNLEGDLRWFFNVRKSLSIATRANIGIATPYYFSDEVPFVKQFFVGGPTSMRGWRIRELGPGGFQDNTQINNNSFYQTGDFKMEFNVEARFNVFWRLKGAVFLDIGNVWALRPGDRPDSGFGNFFNEIAVGSGIGARLDLTYFLLRLDMGYKLRNPFPDKDGNYGLIQSRKDIRIANVNWNLAVGYPF